MKTQIKIAVTKKCNLDCHSCDKTYLEQFSPVHDIEELRSIIAAGNYQSLVICGGEPLLNFSLVHQILSLPVPKKILQTNGVLLTSFKLEQLFRCGLTGLNINVQDEIPFILGDRAQLQGMSEKFDLRIFLHKTDKCVEQELLYFVENGISARIVEGKCGKSVEEDKYILEEK